MLKWLVPPVLVLAYLAATVSAGAPRDRDHDRLPDRWERNHHLSPTEPSAKRDPDGDRLNNRRELRLRTHPRRADTDRDGFSDRCELRKGTNPRKRPSGPKRRCPKSRDLTPPRPAPDGFPNRASTGVPSGWVPRQTRSTGLEVSTPGAVVEDIRFTDGADLIVHAPGVVARRLDFQGGVVGIRGKACTGAQFTIEDSTFGPRAGQAHTFTGGAVIWDGNYIARRVEIINRDEGYRASDCGPPNSIRVEDSFAYIYAADPGTHACEETHADGYQSFHARGATFVNNTILFANNCGTSPFYAGYGGTHPRPSINTGLYNVDRMLVGGGCAVYRHQTRGSVTGLRFINNSWSCNHNHSRCSVLKPWEAKIVETDAAVRPGEVTNPDADFRVTRVVRDLPCRTEVIE